MARNLIVGEEDNAVAEMLHNYFGEQGYVVQAVGDKSTLLDAVRASIPSAIVLSASLPDGDSHALVEELRAMPRISYVPIICLAQPDQYTQSLTLLQSGADDCIAKPFDLEELALRVDNAVLRSERENMTDPRSGLPGAQLVNDHVQSLEMVGDWTYLDFKIEHFDHFRDVQGFVAADEVLHTMAALLRSTMLGYNDRDFIGHLGDEHFVAVTFTPNVDEMAATLIERFNQDVLAHHGFMEREMGFMTIHQGDETIEVPLMSLSIQVIPPADLFS